MPAKLTPEEVAIRNTEKAKVRAKTKLFKQELDKQLNTVTATGYTQLQVIVNKFIKRMLNDEMNDKDFVKYFELLARTQGALKQTPIIENNQKTIFITQEDIKKAHQAIDALINITPQPKELKGDTDGTSNQ